LDLQECPLIPEYGRDPIKRDLGQDRMGWLNGRNRRWFQAEEIPLSNAAVRIARNPGNPTARVRANYNTAQGEKQRCSIESGKHQHLVGS
jgi:hypothetical protein